jgi:hypothetical protein
VVLESVPSSRLVKGSARATVKMHSYWSDLAAVFWMILDADCACVAIGHSNFMHSDVAANVHALRYALVGVPAHYRIGIPVHAAVILIT